MLLRKIQRIRISDSEKLTNVQSTSAWLKSSRNADLFVRFHLFHRSPFRPPSLVSQVATLNYHDKLKLDFVMRLSYKAFCWVSELDVTFIFQERHVRNNFTCYLGSY